MNYHSGEEVEKGDLVNVHGEAAEVEAVVDPECGYYPEPIGAGCILTSSSSGYIYVSAADQNEDLKFVARAAA